MFKFQDVFPVMRRTLLVLLLCTLSLVVGEEGEGREGEVEGSAGEGGELEEGEDQLSKNKEVKESRGTYFYCKSNKKAWTSTVRSKI